MKKPAPLTERQQVEKTRRAERSRRHQEAQTLLTNLAEKAPRLSRAEILLLPNIFNKSQLTDAEWSLLYGKPRTQDPTNDHLKNRNYIPELNSVGNLNYEIEPIRTSVIARAQEMADLSLIFELHKDRFFATGHTQSLETALPWICEQINQLNISESKDRATAEFIFDTIKVYSHSFWRPVERALMQRLLDEAAKTTAAQTTNTLQFGADSLSSPAPEQSQTDPPSAPTQTALPETATGIARS